MSDKPLIDEIDIECFDILHLQAEKIKIAEVFQAFAEIKEPTFCQKVAFQYRLNDACNLFAHYYDIIADLLQHVSLLSEKFQTEILPPFIQNRIDAIMAEMEKNNPELSTEERGVVIGALFAPGGEFDGLYVVNDENQPIVNELWLAKYMNHCEAEGYPFRIKAEFTDEMMVDMDEIYETDTLSAEEKQRQIQKLFDPNGKYAGFLEKAYDKQVEKYVSLQKKSEPESEFEFEPESES